jgi:quercetin dioxygenase-like cupin family protein
MEVETLKAKLLFNKVPGKEDTSLLTFDIPSLVEKMKHKPSWAIGGLNAMILLKNPAKQIVLTALDKGTEIESFQSADSVTFQIIEGLLKFHTKNGSVLLSKGQILTLHEKIKYNLTTREETVFLLTITNSIRQQTEN